MIICSKCMKPVLSFHRYRAVDKDNVEHIDCSAPNEGSREVTGKKSVSPKGIKTSRVQTGV